MICAVSLSAPLTIMVHSVANYRPNLNRIWWYSTHPITENFKSLLTRSNTSSTSTLAYYYKGVPLPCKDTLCSRREAVKFYLIWSVDSLKIKAVVKLWAKNVFPCELSKLTSLLNHLLFVLSFTTCHSVQLSLLYPGVAVVSSFRLRKQLHFRKYFVFLHEKS